jgi:hypothetical protein
MQHEADEILDQARERAERMVQRTEVVKASEARAYQILDTAEAEARRLRHEVEDFCDQKLGSFEIVLERTLKMVSSGRAKLQGTNLTADIPLDERYDDGGGVYGETHQGQGPSEVLGEYDDEDDDDLSHLPPPPGGVDDDAELFDDGRRER